MTGLVPAFVAGAAIGAIVCWAVINKAARLSLARVMFCIGGLFTAGMLVVLVALSIVLFRDVNALGQTSAPPPPAATSGAASAAPGSSSSSPASAASGPEAPRADTTSTIGNAMTAVSVSVAVMTLILTIGTSWFAHKMEEVSKLERRLKKISRRAEALQDLHNKEQNASDALFGAKEDLISWLAEGGDGDLASEVQVWSLRLEMLMSPDPHTRRTAFGQLLGLVQIRQRDEDLPEHLHKVRDYTERCQELALARLEFDTVNENGRQAMHDQLREGLWCLVFKNSERENYYDFINQR